MSSKFIRILSDIHYGDRASQVRSLAQLDPLLDGVDTLILNGDTFDTRPGPYPEQTAKQRSEIEAYFTAAAPHVIMTTGNHDPDLDVGHALELADGQVFVTHGDILFDNIVPWSSEAKLLHGRMIEGRAKFSAAESNSLESNLALLRRVCATLPQRHQAEKRLLKYAVSFLNDTIWPPTRVLEMIKAWTQSPELAAGLARVHRPKAKFIILGHLHRPGYWKTRDGRIVINTGSFCPPMGGYAVDLAGDRLRVRRVTSGRGSFHPGKVLADFALAASAVSPTTTS